MRLLDLILAAFGRAKPAVPDPPTPPTVPGPPLSADGCVTLLLDLHNAARAAAGRPALGLSQPLRWAAQAHADWMAQNRNMSHVETPGTVLFDAVKFDDRIRQTGYKPGACGENIAAGQPDPQAAVDAWVKSPGHYANIVSRDYTEVGFAVAQDKYGARYWCAVFAAPLALGRGLNYENPNCPPAVVYHDR